MLILCYGATGAGGMQGLSGDCGARRLQSTWRWTATGPTSHNFASMTITGALIMALFATVWWVVGLRAAGHGPAVVYPLPVLLAAARAGVAWRVGRHKDAAPLVPIDAAEQARRDRLVAWASAAEGLALFLVAGIVLPSTGHRDATAPMIAVIVGAHFVPLARGLPAPAYYVTAAALTGLGLVGFGVAGLSARVTLVTAGAAVVLWLTAVAVLWSVGRRHASRIRSPAA